MDKKSFNADVLGPLAAWCRYGEETNDMGTRLMGHVPLVAPRAYMHVVYAPLKETELRELSERLLRPIPHQLREFLTYANGLSMFLDEIRVAGYVPLSRRANTSAYNYPSNIMIRNVSARIRGLSHEAVVVGSYKADGSYVSIEKDGTAVRFDSKGTGGLIQDWADFDSWLCSEIAVWDRRYQKEWGKRLRQLY